ncbi:hypothetical protein FN846DRAFT_1022458 [Sphaerosporella brunnea]|uniref:Fungal N-terminal domain-containing protein n=1 Tax=Sphaerosporella brunnea TaxID=1250544 RepID=A0A5J5ESQ7_9PEZI|nr:hypothetical protein FN846DRAFT_1022458 [Sphaerosporella brunnea]
MAPRTADLYTPDFSTSESTTVSRRLIQQMYLGTILAVFQISQAILQRCAEYALAVKDRKAQSRGQILKGVQESIRDAIKGRAPQELQSLINAIDQCSSGLKVLETRLDSPRKQRFTSSSWFQSLKWPLASDEVNRVITELERYKTTIIMALSANQSQFLSVIATYQTQLSQDITSAWQDIIESVKPIYPGIDEHRLPCANGAAFESKLWEHERKCLNNTRVEIIQEITS